MIRVKYILLSSIFFGLLNICLTCNRPEIEFQYQFSENADVYPQKKVYHINDTIWIEYVNSDNRFFDSKTSQRILLDTVSASISVDYYADYAVNSYGTSGAKFCDFIVPSGNPIAFYDGERFNRVSLGFGCNNPLSIKIGIVPKAKGKHHLAFFNQNYISGCPNKVVPLPVSTINYRFVNNASDYIVPVN